MSSAAATPADNRFPAQVKYIVGNEACERFSYYGMRSILALYITSVLAKTTNQATEIIHYFIFANYFTPLLGAWLSDRIWGRYNTILWISLSYCVGHGVLAASDLVGSVEARVWCLYLGLALIAFGSGGIKPCVSAFVGDQFKPDQSHLLQKAYGAFYWSINFGSFFSFLVIPWIKDHHGYGWAFGVPGILMGLATLIFWLGTRHYVRVPPSRETRGAGFFAVLWHALRHRSGRRPGQKFWDVARDRFSREEVDAAASVLPILGVFALIPPFWALFDQSTSTWVLQGAKMEPIVLSGGVLLGFVVLAGVALMALALRWRGDAIKWGVVGVSALSVLAWLLMVALPALSRSGAAFASAMVDVRLLGPVALLLLGLLAPLSITRAVVFLGALGMLASMGVPGPRGALLGATVTIGAEQMQSANPALVMILVPVLTLGVYPLVGRLATPLRRMGAGLVLAALSFVVVAWIQQQIEAGHRISLGWQGLSYLILTAGEVLLSTTGLEFAFTEAGKEMKSTIMSFWLLTVAFGNLLVSWVTKLAGGHNADAAVSSGRFLFYAALTFAVAGGFLVIALRYRYRNPANALGTPAGK